MSFEIRRMTKDDIPACLDIVNHIIKLGGSTAYEEPFTEANLEQELLTEAEFTNVAVSDGRVVGFQSIFDTGIGLYSIGTYTDRRNTVKGAGRALFSKTEEDCRALGGHAILAKITSDNQIGLAYYSKMGFRDFQVVAEDHIRSNGTAVDRVIKRFAL